MDWLSKLWAKPIMGLMLGTIAAWLLVLLLFGILVFWNL